LNLSTNSWKVLEIPRTVDITAIQMYGEGNTLTIFNIYNSCLDDNTMDALNKYLNEHILDIYGNNKQVIWLGDFNRHHPMWDDDSNDQLFTPHALRSTEELITLLAKWDMTMLLLKGVHTLKH
jgi:Endonuclease-reverse transcriptase